MPNDEKIIFSRKIAVQLREQGFQILRTEVNKLHPQFDCWVFENTEDLRRAFDKLLNSRQ